MSPASGDLPGSGWHDANGSLDVGVPLTSDLPIVAPVEGAAFARWVDNRDLSGAAGVCQIGMALASEDGQLLGAGAEAAISLRLRRLGYSPPSPLLLITYNYHYHLILNPLIQEVCYGKWKNDKQHGKDKKINKTFFIN